MRIAALPKYLDTDLKRMPPGHRFGAYFPVWDIDTWTILKEEGSKNNALKSVLEFPYFKKQMEALKNRQNAIAVSLGDNMLCLHAQSVSPFVTGTGVEHPLENGFAFLNPYGLPYFPGSGVKGVLRRTAELLIEGEFNGDTQGWSQESIDELFGLEPKDGDQAARGALGFWDVLIEPKDCKLDIDIFTPHFGAYYAGETTPHESGQPVPIPFLVVPPGATFIFSVQCVPALIGDELIRKNWKALVESLFQEAFDWLGFGAKTAVGYGQMTIGRQAEERARLAQEKAKREAELEKLSQQQRKVTELNNRFDSAPVGEKDNAQGPLRQALRELAVEADAWLTEDR